MTIDFTTASKAYTDDEREFITERINMARKAITTDYTITDGIILTENDADDTELSEINDQYGWHSFFMLIMQDVIMHEGTRDGITLSDEAIKDLIDECESDFEVAYEDDGFDFDTITETMVNIIQHITIMDANVHRWIGRSLWDIDPEGLPKSKTTDDKTAYTDVVNEMLNMLSE